MSSGGQTRHNEMGHRLGLLTIINKGPVSSQVHNVGRGMLGGEVPASKFESRDEIG
jgi:hypothetical protein